MNDSLSRKFGRFYERNFDFVYGLARNLQRHDADDLCHEVFLVALHKYDGFDPTRSRSKNGEHAWLRKIIWHLTQNRRRSAFHSRNALESFQYQARIHDSFGQSGEYQALAQLLLDEFLNGLDESSRVAFVFSRLGGMSSREIARRMSENHNTVQYWLRKADSAFAKRFDQDSRRIRLIADAQTSQARANVRAAIALSPAWVARQASVLGKSGVSGWAKVSPWSIAKLGSLAGATVMTVMLVGDAAPVKARTESRDDQRPMMSANTPPPRSSTLHSPGDDTGAPASDSPIAVVASTTPGTNQGRSDKRANAKPARIEASSSSPTVPKEQLLAARQLIQQGRADEALDILRGSPAPRSGVLGFHWRASEVYALCVAGREREAKGRIRVWDAEHPGDFSAQQVKDPCHALKLSSDD